jgi:hypothetical protein
MATKTTSPDRKPKTSPMKWLKLGEAKDPEFNKMVFLYDSKVPKVEAANIGWLKAIESEIGKKVYKFCIGDDGDKDIVNSGFTHYAIIKAPVE